MTMARRAAAGAAFLLMMGVGGKAPAADALKAPQSVMVYSRVVSVMGTSVPPDAYTRLTITKVAEPAEPALPYWKRRALLRIALGKRYLNSAVLKVSAGAFTATTTLLTIDHASSSNIGETFSRAVAGDIFNFPLFLVETDSSKDTASFQLLVSASDDNQAAGASIALGATKQLIEVAQPSSKIVTTLTSEKAKDVATAIDNAFDHIFASSVAETQTFDVRLRDNKKVRLDILIPCREGAWDSRSPTKEVPDACKANPKEPLLIGSWLVGFDVPRPSLFSEAVCKPVEGAFCTTADLAKAQAIAVKDAEGRPAAILTFKLVEGLQDLGTIGSYLRQQSWWADAVAKTLAAPAGTPPKAAPDMAGMTTLCQKIANALTGIGLSTLDGKLVAFAVANSDMVSPDVGQKMGGISVCSPNVKAINERSIFMM